MRPSFHPKATASSSTRLAAAYASAGNFDQAVRVQKQALAVAPKSFSPQFAQRLALYQQHHPYHNEAATGAPDHQVRAASLETQ